MVACAVWMTTTLAPDAAYAKPAGPMLFCASNPDAPTCQGTLPTCDMCHLTTYPVSWNAFGVSLFPGLGGDFESNLGAAIAGVAAQDADGDGVPNGVEDAQAFRPGRSLGRFVVGRR